MLKKILKLLNGVALVSADGRGVGMGEVGMGVGGVLSCMCGSGASFLCVHIVR